MTDSIEKRKVTVSKTKEDIEIFHKLITEQSNEVLLQALKKQYPKSENMSETIKEAIIAYVHNIRGVFEDDERIHYYKAIVKKVKSLREDLSIGWNDHLYINGLKGDLSNNPKFSFAGLEKMDDILAGISDR